MSKQTISGLQVVIRRDFYTGLFNIYYETGGKWGGPYKTKREAVERLSRSLDEEVKPPVIHPTGTHKAKLIEFGEIKQARSGTIWFLQAKFETEHGFLWSSFAGSPDALIMIRRAESFYKTVDFALKVRHVKSTASDYLFAQAHIHWSETEIENVGTGDAGRVR